MPGIQGICTFPGIQQVVSGEISFAMGITPSSATLTIAPQQNLVDQVGTLSFFDGQTEIDWPNCKVDTNSFERTSAGFIWRLTIYDRRWMWQATGGGGVVTQGINFRTEDGDLIKDTEKSLQDAAKVCLDALGETGYDVSALPTDERPELIWDAAVPAQCLEDMCEQFGYRVVLGLDNNVKICKVGVGADLPITPDIMTNSMSIKLPAMPDTLAVVTAQDRFQVDLALEAVGIENDTYGTLKPIGDLSYMPSDGWGDTDVCGFEDVYDFIYQKYSSIDRARKCQNLAKKSVFRYYRVIFPIPSIPGYVDSKGNVNAPITYPWQVKLESTQVEHVSEDLGLPELQRRNKPAQIFGVYHLEDDGK